MSREVHVQFEVKSATIMKKTLTELGHAFEERGSTLHIGRRFHDIRIDTATGKISYDDMCKGEVNGIKQAYMVNFYKNEAIKEGMQLREERQANGDIVLTMVR
jgi:hypothetical protein